MTSFKNSPFTPEECHSLNPSSLDLEKKEDTIVDSNKIDPQIFNDLDDPRGFKIKSSEKAVVFSKKRYFICILLCLAFFFFTKFCPQIFPSFFSKSSNQPSLNITLFDHKLHQGGWKLHTMTNASIIIPSLSDYDTLHIYLTLICADKENCPWDYQANLYLISSDSQLFELARWVTPFGRNGSWKTDISSMISLLTSSGVNTFGFKTAQSYYFSISLCFTESKKGSRPIAWKPLWVINEYLDLEYNKKIPTISFKAPQATKKIEIYVIKMGKGWGTEKNDCAEFCNTDSFFILNDQYYWRDSSRIAGTLNGCENLVPYGVIDDQEGTWQLGRNNWCPGWHVLPIIYDITTEVMMLAKNEEKTLKYQELFENKEFDVEVNTQLDENSRLPSIDLASYLVFWE